MSHSRGPSVRSRARADRIANQLASLAGRLTDRDRQLAWLIWEHRVLTAPQITRLFFPSQNSAERRLARLYKLDLVERFRPFRDVGSAPYYYVLGGLGAELVAAEHGIDVKELGWRRDKALALAVNQRLGHLVGVNEFFTQLGAYAQDASHDAQLLEWRSERRCRHVWGPLIQPDGFGSWRQYGTELDFFLEYDNATETLARVTEKLAGYAQLGHSKKLLTPVLFWLPSSGRERTVRKALAVSADAQHVLIATAHSQHGRNPARAVWLPLGQQFPRRHLIELADPVTWRPPTDTLPRIPTARPRRYGR